MTDQLETCFRTGCLLDPERSTSDPWTPDPPDVGAATKPVYSLDQIVNALRSADGTRPTLAWSGDAVTFSVGTGPLGAGHPDYRPEYSGYVAMSPTMEATAAESFALWDELIAIDLVEVADDSGADVVFNYSSATGGSTYASSQYSGAPNERADYSFAKSTIWLADDWWTHDEDSDLTEGGYGIMTYLHEIGHSLGLTHPGAYNGSATFANDATHFQDTRAYSVMSYFNAGANGASTDQGWNYGATPLLHDIAAVQAIYGADMTTRTGGTTYGFNANAGRDAFDFTVNDDPVVAIWDAGGIDKIDVSGWSTDQVIDLRAGAFSSVRNLTHNVAIAHGVTIELADGGGGNDQVIGNDANNVLAGLGGDDTLTGAEGHDVLIGGAGADILDGGAGDDWARYAGSASGVDINLQTGTGAGGDAAGDLLSGIEHVSGSAQGDTLTGDHATANRLFGLGGDDTLTGGGGHDFLLGNDGDDTILGGTGRDVMRGGAGADYIDGGSEDDWIQFNDAAGGVSLDLGAGLGFEGDAAGDTYVSVENVRGSDYRDIITGSSGRNIILGGGGDDVLDGGGGPDVIHGEAGDDLLIGSSSSETFYGGAGADQIDGGGGNDWARYDNAGAGVSVSLLTGSGTAGEAAGDTLTGIEWLWGSAYGDSLAGDDSANMIRGGGGDDTITGRGGNDVLEGHGGADRFVFGAGAGIDRIHGFEIGTDLIEISGTVTAFGQLTISDFRGEAAIAYDTGDVILLTGITAGEVIAEMFVFS